MTATPTEREAESTWTRLRRRKVVQWGLVYVAAAWGFLQGLEYVGEAFHWPEQLRQIALIALLIGLPIVLVIAWYHGDRGHQRISTPEFAILTLLLLLGGGAFWYYQRTSETATVATPPSPTAVVAATDRSIAVLPFVNMSPDKEQEYFADGISEELINLLAQVPELRVIARTSSFSFKGKEVDIAEIARKLNVANVLDGSVRKSGDRLRITAQLIRASDSSNLWSETYERPLDNIFAVQDEIAAAVLEQLKLELLGVAPKTKASDPKAYTLFLQARHWGRQGTPEGLERSIALYQRALAIDANDAAAWKGLANDYLNQASNGLRPIDEGYRLARNAVEKALAIDSDYAPAHGALGWIAMTYDGDLAAAARSYEHALALEPTNIDIIGNAATLAQFLGRLDTASALDEYANARDPVNAPGHANLGTTYLYAGRLDEALESYRTALSLSPDAGSVQYSIGVALLLKGDPAAALAAMQKESSEVWRMIGSADGLACAREEGRVRCCARRAGPQVREGLGLQRRLRTGLPRRGRPRLRMARQGGRVPRPGPGHHRGQSVVREYSPGPALVAVPAQGRQGAGATRGDQVRCEAAELGCVAQRSFDGCP